MARKKIEAVSEEAELAAAWAILNRTGAEIRGSAIPRLPPPERIPFTAPTGPHPIATYFTPNARKYAASNNYAPLHIFGTRREIAIESATDTNYTNPDSDARMRFMQWGYAPSAWPCPLTRADYSGAGVAYNPSPLGYMLYHDRQSRAELATRERDWSSWDTALPMMREFAMEALTLGVPHAHAYLQELADWTESAGNGRPLAAVRSGRALRPWGGTPLIHWSRGNVQTVFSDPTGVMVATMILGGPLSAMEGENIQLWALIHDQAEDFGTRWKRGEWYNDTDTPGQQASLRTLLRV